MTASFPSLRGLKVLLAEDAIDNQILIRRFLESSGASMDWAKNGLEACMRVLQTNYDLVLMDIQMPEMDGIQATKKLRASGFQKPILALTAHAMKSEISKSLEAGCNEHLIKPISKNHLVSSIRRHLPLL
ncbi:MAG: response regulator [Pseudobdellovibrionaceae bacterium]